MNDTGLVRQVYDTVAGYEQLGNEVFEADGGTFVRNRAFPRRHVANHVTPISSATPAAIDRLFQRVEQEFAGFRHRRFNVNPFTPPACAARLTLGEWQVGEYVQLLLEGDLPVRSQAADIRPVQDDADWAAYRSLEDAEWKESVDKQRKPFDPTLTAEFVASKRAKCPAARHWIAYAGGVACAYGSSWSGRSGVGIVEDLFTHPAYRHRGMATAIIAHGVAAARREGAGPIVIGAAVDDTPKHMYAALGFRPLLVTRTYTRVLRAT